MRMLQPLCVCRAYASGTDAQAEHTRKAMEHMRQELMRMLSICISFPIFQRRLLKRFLQQTMLSIRVRNWCAC